MAPTSTLNPEAPVFVPARLAAKADLTTTNALLAYFSNLRFTTTSIEPDGRSAPALVPYRSNHCAARAAMEDFAYYYGEDPDNLAAWQALLSSCAFEVIPESLEECKNVRIRPPSLQLPVLVSFRGLLIQIGSYSTPFMSISSIL
jgi:Ataxin-2 C-terminal region